MRDSLSSSLSFYNTRRIDNYILRKKSRIVRNLLRLEIISLFIFFDRLTTIMKSRAKSRAKKESKTILSFDVRLEFDGGDIDD